jgi:predicted N-acetyltransferase YhbS
VTVAPIRFLRRLDSFAPPGGSMCVDRARGSGRLSTIYDMLAPTGLPDTPAIDGPRAARADDVPEIIALVDAEMRAGSDQSLLTDYPLVYAASNLHNVRVLRIDGELVSVVPVLPRDALIAGRRTRIGVISPTATAPGHRHRGYATCCLESAIEAMRAEGCALSVLWTLVATFPFYEHSGYHAVRYHGVAFELAAADASRFAPDPSVTIRTLDPADEPAVDAVRRMHERDEDTIRRRPQEYPALLDLPRMQTLLAIREGRPQGYLVVSSASNKPGIIEAGGDRPAIATLIHRVLTRLDPGATIEAHVNRAPSALSLVLDRRVPERRTLVPAGMMVRINDLGALLGSEPDLSLGRAEWAAALFGSHPARPFVPPATLAAGVGVPLPLDLSIPVLDRS